MVTTVPIISSGQIAARCRSLARFIHRIYPVHLPLFVIVQKGAAPFAETLLSCVGGRTESISVTCKSYEGTERKDEVSVSMTPHDRNRIWNEDILVIEDIVDSGNTVTKLAQVLLKDGAKDVACLPLIARTQDPHPLVVNKGFVVPSDKFLVGFGMDYNEEMRDLPSIYYLEK